MANRKPLFDELLTGGELRCGSVEETVALGEEAAKALGAGRVLSLEGPLGAGKTHFVKGLARGAGYPGVVSSPTFTLIHEYLGGAFPVYHFDLYRLESPDEVMGIGFDDYMDGGGLVAIEWGDRFSDLLPAGVLRVRIDIEGTDRVFRIGEAA